MTGARRAAILVGVAAVLAAACAANPPKAAPTTVPAPAAPTSVRLRPSTTVAPAPTTAAPTSAAATSAAPTTSPSTTRPKPVDVAACVARLTVRQRAALLTWPGVYGNQWEAATALVRTQQVGGVVLMTAPAGDVGAALNDLRAANPRGLLVSTDEEGGKVQRLARLGALPSARAMAAEHTPAEARELVATHAAVLREAGIDVVLAPVVDVDSKGGTSPLGDRLFSDDPQRVTDYATAYVQAWTAAGILPVLKHFPGHGGASADTHDRAGVTPPLAQLQQRDLVPYRALAGSGAAVMVGHLTVPWLTDRERVPTSMSTAAITTLLRGELGYADALVMTDALEMGAVAQIARLPQAAVASLVAGADVVLFSAGNRTAAVIDAITSAVDRGRLSEARLQESAVRVARRYEPKAFCQG